MLQHKNQLPREFFKFLHTETSNVFTKTELVSLFTAENQRPKRSISEAEKCIDELLKQQILRQIKIVQPNGNELRLFVKEVTSIYEIAVKLKPACYISHHTAAYLHKLTDVPDSIIYATHEQSPKVRPQMILEQQSVDKAFKQPQKTTNAKYTFGDHAIFLLNGMYSAKEGVYQKKNSLFSFPITNIERTLIDITVRPGYSGGATAVLAIFKKAVKNKFSIEELIGILNTMPFIYPYHQSIGFYLERSGYSGSGLTLLKNKGLSIDFYLDYAMQETRYSKDWKIYYPARLDNT